MKKLLALVLVMVCVLGLVGCDMAQIINGIKNDVSDTDTSNTDVSDTDLTDVNTTPPTAPFSSDSCNQLAVYFDEQQFVPSLSQGEFISQVEKYSYNGEEFPVGCHYDGPMGGGWQATGELFGFYNDYSADDESGIANYSNRLYTTVQLGGLDLPFGVVFDDTLATVLQKFGIDLDLESNFAWDEDCPGTLTLYGDERSLLQLFNCKLSAEGSQKPNYNYELRYTETSQYTLSDGRIVDVTRQINMFFHDVNDKLGCFEMLVNETYSIRTSNENQ